MVKGGVGDGAQIIEANVIACKSVVHIIDRLLIPSVAFEGAPPVSPTTTQSQRAFKQAFPELHNLDLSTQNIDWIVEQLSSFGSLNDTQLFELYKPRSQSEWLQNLNKHLVLVGLSESEILEFEQDALEYLQGGVDPTSTVSYYRSFRQTEFNPNGINQQLLSKNTLQNMDWSLDGQQAVSSVYVAMYDSVKNSDSQKKECKSLIEVISSSPELSTVMDLLQRSSNQIFMDYGEDITMFLPHNRAFFENSGTKFLVETQEGSVGFLEHVSAYGTYSMAEAMGDGTIYSINGFTEYSISTDVVQDFYGQPTETYTATYYGQHAKVLRSVPHLCAGALHIIDQLILPESLL
eukprot:TRINITY_DN7023_c0_g1_i5.p1 TRINITY_DN7023_c0_g1~~TRINITY_DN7023_c0_g1_i5.p1  ORF type:complete len:349 (+),score=54.29 TRINITY_DN7023_c0_g1_i5:259-1305(+)